MSSTAGNVVTRTPAPPRRRRRRLLLVLAGVLVGIVVLAAVGLVVLVTLKDRAPDVPDSFRAPTALPGIAGALPVGILLYDSDRSGSFEVYLSQTPGAPPSRLTDDRSWDSWWPQLSPDRTRILFYRTPAGVHDTDFTKTELWMMNTDGSGLTWLRPPGLDGWAQQGHAEWRPDGAALVMFGGKVSNPQVYVTDITGQHPRAVTDRGGVSIDPSFSPDGRSVAFIGCPHSICRTDDYEVYVIGADGSGARRLTDDHLRDQDPAFSPDGTRIAWLTRTEESKDGGSWNIRIAAADGSGQRRLTDDDEINSKPEWSRDGRTIFFHRYVRGTSNGFDIYSVPASGGARTEITEGQPGINEFPST